MPAATGRDTSPTEVWARELEGGTRANAERNKKDTERWEGQPRRSLREQGHVPLLSRCRYAYGHSIEHEREQDGFQTQKRTRVKQQTQEQER